MDLFSMNETKIAPLADRMRAKNLDEFVGQKHIVATGSLLRRAIEAGVLGSCIFWGPPGTGKSTLAGIIAGSVNADFRMLNAVQSGIADAKKVIEEAKNLLRMYGKRTYLLLDECHRWNKAQSDSMLEAIEKGYIIFIGSTTENPYVSMTPAIVSRCRVFEFKKLSDEDIASVVDRSITDKERGLGNLGVTIDADAKSHFVWAAGGDLRNALNAVELAALTTKPDEKGRIVIDLETAQQSIQKKALSVDENLYYDILSAFCKSLRGSDADAALYWANRLISAGCDPMLIARRLVVHSSEDVGMADPNALVVATSAMYAYEKIGLPEGLIPLSNAIIYVCEAPKSNDVVTALGAAKYDAENTVDDNVPTYLRDAHYRGSDERNRGQTYLYPHDFGGYVKQQYLPDKLKDKTYYKNAKRKMK